MDDMISRAYVLAEYDRQHKGPPGGARNIMEEAPAVDAVPVVRCAECRHCFDLGNDPMEPYDGESEWYCDRWDTETSARWKDPYKFFCADGERRET